MTMFKNKRSRLRRLAAAGAMTLGVLAAGGVFAASASAHVKVSGIDAVQGGSGVLTFRVPSESATASTTGLLITFPAGTPFTSVDVQPKAGWQAKVTKKPLAKPQKNDDGDEITEYVSQVDYTAASKAAAIPPGVFDMFNPVGRAVPGRGERVLRRPADLQRRHHGELGRAVRQPGRARPPGPHPATDRVHDRGGR